MIVCSWNGLGYPYLHFPFLMHGAFGFKAPQGPCTMKLFRASNNQGWVSGSGHLALIIVSMTSDVRSLCSPFRKIRRCMWGSPRFWNLITYTWAMQGPKMPSLSIAFNSVFFFSWNTRDTKSGRSFTAYPGSSSRVISGQLGFVVIVKKISIFLK